jgi:hypothetical protein
MSEELGTKDNPRIGLDDSAIETKFRDFAKEHLTDKDIEEALGRCWTLDQQADMPRFLSKFEIGAMS